jgi:CDP-glycerol glycerophosphotransferase (TagB/SpsB family)
MMNPLHYGLGYISPNVMIYTLSRRIVMAFGDDLFDNGIDTILHEWFECYPLYVYCFLDILNSEILVKLQRNLIDSGQEHYVSQSPKAGKILPYLRNLLKGNARVENVDILFVSRYRPAVVDIAKALRTDYLFHSVINEIFTNPPHSRMALVSVGGEGEHYTDERVDNFGLFDFLSLGILLRTTFRSLGLYLRYRGIVKKLSRIQRKMFNEFFSFPSLLYCNLIDSCLAKAIYYLKPKVIVANDDVLIFKPNVSTDFKMVVVQSALIAEYSEKNKHTLFSSFLDNSLLSDYYCVSGPKYESLKKRFLKDTKKIVVTGQPRFDSLVNANILFDGNEIRRKLGLNEGKKILLWTTEAHSLTLEENKENIAAIYHAVSVLNNVQLIIKLHPAEDQQASLYGTNHSCVPIIAKRNQDLHKLLFVCDLMITKASASATEAAIMDKPIIILNLSGKPDIIPYVEKGVALGVYRKEDLIPTIKQILFDLKVREKLAKARERFVYDYAYLQDGKASERVANLIVSLIEVQRSVNDIIAR